MNPCVIDHQFFCVAVYVGKGRSNLPSVDQCGRRPKKYPKHAGMSGHTCVAFLSCSERQCMHHKDLRVRWGVLNAGEKEA